ncbi:fatty-acid amide hydrolase 2 [Caerostris extrusa]|uniref:Fatty-acid amide hydrolase 2 n=1 Tax=Caerostris extrusa TaxID=172846 RepID=A0AAV4VB11_CAEEX|nr:fatty-acid amide hydrolase 2 [Caerostris extrusa]
MPTKTILTLDPYYLFIMTYYLSTFVKNVKSPQKFLISILMFFYRWFTGYLTDLGFGFINAFGRKSSALPPVQNPLLLDSALSLAAKIRKKQVCVLLVYAYRNYL